MKKRILIISLIFAVAIVSALFIGRAFSFEIAITEMGVPTEYQITYPSELQLGQTLNNCAAYSAACAVSIVHKSAINPEDIAKNMKWRVTKGLTLPFGLMNALSDNKVAYKEILYGNLPDYQKIYKLKLEISQGDPMILLVKVHGVQHYFTLLGYKQNYFMVYDSLQARINAQSRMTIDENGDQTGNRNIDASELLKLWSGGGQFIFFNYWGIICKKRI